MDRRRHQAVRGSRFAENSYRRCGTRIGHVRAEGNL
jgi:hypothetical protein